MATLIKNSTGAFTLPETLTQGSSYMGGTVQFDSTTGKPLQQGGTTLSRPQGSQPLNLNNNQTMTSGTPPVPTNQPMTFNQVLADVLKNAQKGNADRYTGNNTALLKGKENIEKTNADTYSEDLGNANLSNDARLGILGNDQNLQSPGLRSIESQQSFNKSHYDTESDNLKSVVTSFENEQNRIAKAKSDLQDAEYKSKALAETIRSNKATEANSRQNNAKLGGLTAAQINATVNNIAGQFDGEQTVKDYNTANASLNAIRNIGVKTKSPTDDMAFIYAFAKIMDPNSVVREGEYKTVQDYGQSLVQRYATGVKRVVDNSNFLTEDAKTKMLSTLESKVGSIKKSYDNVAKEYQRQINDAYSGKARQITNYSGVETGASGSVSVQDPTGATHQFPDQKSADAFKKAAGIK